MVTLRQLEVFQTVVRIGSVTAAADALYVSQPTVSDTLRALEHELGEPLFTGSRRARQLTRAGEVYKRFVDRALAAVDDGSRAVGDLGETVGGQLSLLAVTTAGEHLMPPVIHEFLTRYPEVEVTLMVANRAGARTPIAESVIDLAIMGRPPVGVSVESLRIGPNRLMLVAAPHHVLAGPDRTRAWPETTLLLREEGSGSRAAAEEAVDELGLAPSRTMVIGSNAALLAAVREGLGVAVVPEVAVTADLSAGRLVAVDVPGFPLERDWNAVWPADRPLFRSAQAFVETLVEFGEALPG